jgi:thymidine phosphorylase
VLGTHTEKVTAHIGGTIGHIDAMAVATAAWRLGAGRAHRADAVQSGAGVRIHRRPGEPVAAGEPVFTLYTDTPDRIGPAVAALDGGWSLGEFSRRSLVIDRIVP